MSDKAVLNIKPLGFPWQTRDPFLFCAYHHDIFPAGNEQLGPDASLGGRMIGQDFQGKDGWNMYHGRTVPGFPAHPHVGFETVTVVTRGLVDHADSLGAAGRFGNGDVQWMTAGRGVQHSEMFPLLDREKHNELELFQIWLNLPKAAKSADPHFAMLWSEKIPVLRTQDEAGNPVKVTIVAGKLADLEAPSPAPDSWAADPENEVNIWIIELAPGARFNVPPARRRVHRDLFYYRGGGLQAGHASVDAKKIIQLAPDQEATLVNGPEASYLLFLQGRPIGEPVVQQGPFVGNEQADIVQAYREYQRTQFGGWPWPKPDQTHGRDRGRFAKYVDGVVEER